VLLSLYKDFYIKKMHYTIIFQKQLLTVTIRENWSASEAKPRAHWSSGNIVADSPKFRPQNLKKEPNKNVTSRNLW
jgi:hypothetical protein